jgi:signal-transduction protein with cAMP-binding, CBS, and nucleotidyltransferase domain
MDQNIENFLKEHVLFKDYYNEEFIATLARNLKMRVYTDGTYVIRKGEVGRAMFFILRGEVEILSEDGKSL